MHDSQGQLLCKKDGKAEISVKDVLTFSHKTGVVGLYEGDTK